MEGLTACAACYLKSSHLGKMASAIQKREETIQNKEEKMHEWELREKQKRFKLEDSIMRRLQKEGVYVSERGGLIVTDAGMATEARARDEVIAEQTKEVSRIKVLAEACTKEKKEIARKWKNEKVKSDEFARHAAGLEVAIKTIHKEGRMLGRLADSEMKKAKKAVASLFTLREASQKDRLCLQRFRHARRMARQSQRRVATQESLAEGSG